MELKLYRPNSSDANVAAKMNRDVYHARRYVRNGDWVFDIGANVGAFCLFVKEFCGGANVVCVEPMPSNLEALCLNVGRQAFIEAAAISCHSDAVTIYDFGLANSGCHSIYNLGISDAQPVIVQGTTLRELFDKYEIDKLRFLKLDCQGSEYEVIADAEPDLLDRVDVIAMEVHRTIGPEERVLGTIPHQSHKAQRMYERLKETHVLASGSLDKFDSEQVWEKRCIVGESI